MGESESPKPNQAALKGATATIADLRSGCPLQGSSRGGTALFAAPSRRERRAPMHWLKNLSRPHGVPTARAGWTTRWSLRPPRTPRHATQAVRIVSAHFQVGSARWRVDAAQVPCASSYAIGRGSARCSARTCAARTTSALTASPRSWPCPRGLKPRVREGPFAAPLRGR